ncbi:hypothetical protein LINGRAPRIM_LOCUS1142 [Linum grandiflorum]
MALKQVSFNGGLGSLVLDTIGHNLSQKYHSRVIQHEAGHFLIAYLVQRVTPCPTWKLCRRKDLLMSKLGRLSWISSLLKKSVAAASYIPITMLMILAFSSCYHVPFPWNAGQFRQSFCHGMHSRFSLLTFEVTVLTKFDQKGVESSDWGSTVRRQAQVKPGYTSKCCFVRQSLSRFSCIALAGVAIEYILYGYSEGGLADINKLDMSLKGLGFTQKKADSHRGSGASGFLLRLSARFDHRRMHKEISATERCASHQTCNLLNLRARGTIRATWFQPSCTDSAIRGHCKPVP